MGIESDQVVYEYLSRVGDLAQQRQLPSSTRMRLVSGLRDEIDRRRAKAPVDSPAAVRRIIARLGTPEEIVEAAGAPGDVPEPPAAAVPVQRVTGGGAADEDTEGAGNSGERTKGLSRGLGLRRVVPRPRSSDAVPPPVAGAGAGGAAPPHLAPLHELGEGDAQPDWWRVGGGGGPGGDIGFGLGDSVPGFVGGVEIPELLKPPPVKGDADDAGVRAKGGERGAVVEKGAAASAGGAEEGAAVRAPARRRMPLPRLRSAGGGWSNPLLLLAAVLLVAGAVMGSLVPLGLGWLIAYLSRRLTPSESKWAVMGVPGVVAAGGVVWLWGRSDGRWGDPIAQGQMSGALAETWPWVLRVAAVSSALYLFWRSQRPR
ncbi:hypothetical protein IHE56_02070 [Streptomyces sp. ID01-12c]|uniref:hypothetical protein n=1 Tax=Streptomyces caniscabiei TaxID=2746961 RepID=UPI001783FAF6|nr:hypothetical protein [Streptomyces caniscabiei]MBD9700893.1 hypothetical protein [Streptomyces caniscabiei]MDX3727560.1 hypothetical protein [Streptomyces caniscabiei]